jgi:hypothetical protein
MNKIKSFKFDFNSAANFEFVAYKIKKLNAWYEKVMELQTKSFMCSLNENSYILKKPEIKPVGNVNKTNDTVKIITLIESVFLFLLIVGVHFKYLILFFWAIVFIRKKLKMISKKKGTME